MNRLPAHTRHSLLAIATMAPRSAAVSVGLRPAAPVIAPITHSAGRAAASMSALSPAPPAPRRNATACKRGFELVVSRGIGDRGKTGIQFTRQRREGGGIGVGAQRL